MDLLDASEQLWRSWLYLAEAYGIGKQAPKHVREAVVILQRSLDALMVEIKGRTWQ